MANVLSRPDLVPELAGCVDDVVAIFAVAHPGVDPALIRKAAAVAEAAHDGVFRKSGEPYFSHPVAVAGLVAGLGLDDISVAAAFCHDVVEDTEVTLDDLAVEVGSEVAQLVDGLTKLDRLPTASIEESQAATLRKLLVHVARDLRVLIIKLADRLHNMLTIGAHTPDKARRVAAETMEVYAPLAHRLGVGDIKWRLEDLAFRTLEPARYAELAAMVDARVGERSASLQKAISAVAAAVGDVGIDAQISGRVKHLWSAYETMIIKEKALDELTDLVGVRVIVDDVQACYSVLGAINAMPGAMPLAARFKDFVAAPKFNLYQSLHVAVRFIGGETFEIQVRTKEMHRRAEYGLAAHWSYKAQRRSGAEASELAWFERILESDAEGGPAEAFMAQIRADLGDDEVFCFTPKGRVISLPAGSTPVDFAFAIHTDIGYRTTGAKVNGVLVPLRSVLSSGDTVEIMTRPAGKGGPSRDWLGFVRTPRARGRIRAYFARQQRSDALDAGRESLTRVLRLEGLPTRRMVDSAELAGAVKALRFKDLDSLCVALGEGKLAASAVAAALKAELGEAMAAVVATPVRPGRPGRDVERAVHVEGLDDVLVRFAGCCDPRPYDAIIGFVTQGRGVSVHRLDCTNADSLSAPGSGHAERMIDVEWVGAPRVVQLVSIEVSALDRAKLLRDVAAVLSDAGVNIISSNTHTSSDRSVRQRFDFELADRSHLGAVLEAVAAVDAVYDVRQLVAS